MTILTGSPKTNSKFFSKMLNHPYAVIFSNSFFKKLKQASLVTELGFYCLLIFVFSQLWKSAIGASTIHGYSYNAIIWYLITTEAVTFAAPSRIIENIGREISNGQIQNEMTRPISIIGFRFADSFGSGIATLAIFCPIGILLGLLFVGLPENGFNLLIIPSAIIGITANLFGIYLFSSISFWLRDFKATWFIYQKLTFIPGGMIIPLQFLPSVVQKIAFYIPFWTFCYAPGRFAAGFNEPMLLLGQITWALLLAALAVTAFHFGQRKIQKGA